MIVKNISVGVFCLVNLTVYSQGLGVSSIGASGGLTIPSAYVLDSGDGAASIGNNQNPNINPNNLLYPDRRNYTLGFGLGNGVELFGRLVNYQNNMALVKNKPDVSGPRDMSGNLKWKLPFQVDHFPTVAIGMTDVSGGAVLFKSVYTVATDDFGPVRWSLGYAKGQDALGKSGTKVLSGFFGGVETRIFNTQATALAETDGTHRYVGLRYYSNPIPWLADSQIIGSVQHSNADKSSTGVTSFNTSLVFPLDGSRVGRESRVKALASAKPLTVLNSDNKSSEGINKDRLTFLVSALKSSGLDRIRFGFLGSDLVVEYENHRYLHNEVDALGIALGLAAELAPAKIRRIYVISLKSDKPFLEASVDAFNYRAWLRDEAETSSVKSSFGFGRLAGYDAQAVKWIDEAEVKNKIKIQLSPILNYTLGTEYGLFDYSLAVQARGDINVWPGGDAYVDIVKRIDSTKNMSSDGVFSSSRQKDGVKTAALQQSIWLGKNLLASVGAGVYEYKAIGFEGESIYFLPSGEDTIHVRGKSVNYTDATAPKFQDAWSAAYRWKISPVTWVEGGLNAYTDASRGPSLALTRWFGDVAVNMQFRKGGNNSFVGIELNFPLTPRQGMTPEYVQVSGAQRFDIGLRTLVASGSNKLNYVRPNSVRMADINYQPEVEFLNSGRIGSEYVISQLPRMRESFYMYARGFLPN